ncbi:MAG: hypothetical protein ACR2LV_01470 [Solirubrobacteraceae bacterium]
MVIGAHGSRCGSPGSPRSPEAAAPSASAPPTPTAPGSLALGAPRAIEGAQDLDRLGAQGLIDGLIVRVGQLPGPVVEVGVPDLAVLGLPGGVQLGDLDRLRLLETQGRPSLGGVNGAPATKRS